MDKHSLQQLIGLARDAGEAILAVSRSDIEVAYKSPGDPVTNADRAANQLICRGLDDLFPGVCIVAEESPPEAFAGYRQAPECFFVDPLDGTREFLANNGEFVVMIGYVEGNRAVAGAVWAPTQRRGWAGGPELGAFIYGPDGSHRPIQATRIDTLARARFLTSRVSPSHLMRQSLQALGVSQVIERGSAGLKGVAVADGEADVYLSPGPAGKKWDACAIDAIVTGAGGTFTDINGQAIDYRSSLTNATGLLATNGPLKAQLLERLGPLLAARRSGQAKG